MSNEQQEKKVGLEWLDDEDLAAIVEHDLQEGDGLKTTEAVLAFNELARRSGN